MEMIHLDGWSPTGRIALGGRLLGNGDRGSDVFDIGSFNDYSTGDRQDMMTRICDLVKKPIMIGEFHFGTAERGCGPGLVMMSSQTTPAQAFRHHLSADAAATARIAGCTRSTRERPGRSNPTGRGAADCSTRSSRRRAPGRHRRRRLPVRGSRRAAARQSGLPRAQGPGPGRALPARRCACCGS